MGGSNSASFDDSGKSCGDSRKLAHVSGSLGEELTSARGILPLAEGILQLKNCLTGNLPADLFLQRQTEL
jgi:hypothetical protein